MSDNHFGFQSVSSEEKIRRVKSVFDSVASRYDIMNDVMSFGLHRLWKSHFISKIPFFDKDLLDIAGGTGDIAFSYLKRSQKYNYNPNIYILDMNHSMLKEGRKRADRNGWFKNPTWLCADAQSLPFPDSSLELITIAFGIRNVSHIEKALSEAYRVLKPGGLWMCLEFSQVALPWLAKCYDTYSFHLIPMLGQLITNDKESYQYLVESIRRFPDAERFSSMINQAGFVRTQHQLLTGGITAIHQGWRIR
jgi:demethylmenaquinone methyltransferase / 2-methoxy-6-polyprenyl-1,4-benzoquinol methylase